jgi:hypothetical protein
MRGGTIIIGVLTLHPLVIFIGNCLLRNIRVSLGLVVSDAPNPAINLKNPPNAPNLAEPVVNVSK